MLLLCLIGNMPRFDLLSIVMIFVSHFSALQLPQQQQQQQQRFN